MNRKYFLLISLALVALAARAQHRPAMGYDFTRGLMPWALTSNTAALLLASDTARWSMSDATLSLDAEAGKWHTANQPRQAWRPEVGVRSLQRLSARTLVEGSASYAHTTWLDYSGSAMLAPLDAPFNIVPLDAPAGKLTGNTYHLSGLVAHQLSHIVNVSALADFTAQDRARLRDPRFKNTLSQLHAAASATMRIMPRLYAGASYAYDRRIETLAFRLYGSTDQVYTYLIDRGAQLGFTQSTDEQGYAGDESEKPLSDKRHTAALQLAYHGARWRWEGEASHSWRRGHYGVESAFQVDYEQHHGHTTSLQLTALRQTASNIHRVHLAWDYTQLTAEERAWRSETSTGSIAHTTYYGTRQMGRQRNVNLRANYRADLALRPQAALWTIEFNNRYANRLTTAYRFPELRQHRLWQAVHHTSLTRRLLHGATTLQATVGLSVAYGEGSDYTDYIAPHVGLGAHFPLTSGINGFVRADYQPQHGHTATATGAHWRHAATLTLGCDF